MRATTGAREAKQRTVEDAGSDTGQFLYETFYGGAIGGCVIALFFLAHDALRGEPLFTPSLIGSALFTGVDPASVTGVRLDMVAYFSIVHFASFLGLGAIVSAFCRRTRLAASSPVATLALVFVLLCAAFFVGEGLAMPGVSAVIGLPWILAANAVTAAAMALFFQRTHRTR